MKADEWYAPLFSIIQASGLSHKMVGSPTRSLCKPLGGVARELAEYMEECGFAIYQKQKRLIEDFVSAQLRLQADGLKSALNVVAR